MKNTKFQPGRWLIVISLAALITFATGCMHNPVPANKIDIKTPRGSYQIATPKNVAIEKFKASVDTNGTVEVAFDSWTSTNDPQVVDKSYAGQALVMKTAFEGANQLAEKLVEGAAKGMKGGASARKLDVDGIALERVSGKVCESEEEHADIGVRAPSAPPRIYFYRPHGPTFAALNQRFTKQRLTKRDAPFVWSLNQVNLIRPDLIGYGADTAWLTKRQLGVIAGGPENPDPNFPQFAVRNRAGWPVKLEARILRAEVNLLSADTADAYTLYSDHFPAYERVTMIVQAGHWLVQTRVKDQGFEWNPLQWLSPGDTYVYLYKNDFLPREYQALRSLEK